MELRYGEVRIKIDSQGHIDAQARGTLTNMEWIASLELLKSQAVEKLKSLTTPSVKISGRQIT